MEQTKVKTRRSGALRRLVAKVGVIGLIVGGTVAITAISAGADAADVSSTEGSAVVNPDGSITVTVQGTWVWSTHTSDCNTNRFGVGWQVDWNDTNAPGNFLATLNLEDINVGVLADGAYNDADNLVHYPADPPRCGAFNDPPGYNSGSWGPISHTYAPGTDPASIQPCAVVYDLHSQDDALKPGDDVAGGDDHNKDNSVESNDQTPAGNVCAGVTIEPDVSIVKTGPDAAIVGQQFTYNLEATNTGIVDANDVTITDVIPGNVNFISATAPCTYDEGTRTVSCDVGTLGVGESTSVQITVTPTEATEIVNTATVTPDDITPADNTSTWTITNVTVSPAAVVAPVATAPAFTG